MKLTKNNVKVGDRLYVIPSDKRKEPWYFTVGKIARKYIIDEYGYNKIEIGTNEIFRKDGIGAVEKVYLSEEKYNEYKSLKSIRSPFANRMYNSSNIFDQMSVEDMEAITKIMCKYDKEWAIR